MKWNTVKVYIVSYETPFGNCVEQFRTYDKAEAEREVEAFAEDGTKAFIDVTFDNVYR